MISTIVLTALLTAVAPVAPSASPEDARSKVAAPSAPEQSSAFEPDSVVLNRVAAEDGKVRPIVGLPSAEQFQPEGDLLPEAATLQRQEIAEEQDGLLDALKPSLVTGVKQFESIPYIALTTNAAGVRILQGLLQSGEVLSIEQDLALKTNLWDTPEIVQADDLWAEGLEGTGIMVAVLDTGVQRTHSFFGGSSSRVVSEACYSTNDPPNDSYTLCPNGGTSQTPFLSQTVEPHSGWRTAARACAKQTVGFATPTYGRILDSITSREFNSVRTPADPDP